MSESLRILVLADASSFHTERFVAQLRLQGCTVLLASLEKGISECHLLSRIGPLSSLHYLLAGGQVRKLVGNFAPDIVNPHFATGYGFLASVASSVQFPPIVLNLWGSDVLLVPKKSILHRTKLTMAIESASLVCADSGFLLNQARAYKEPRESAVIPWGIEREFLENFKPQKSFEQPLRIIVPRHHEHVYNNEFILRSLALSIKAAKVTLTIPSWGSKSAQFQTLANALECRSIKYYDRKERRAFMQMMSEHDVYLSASSSDSSPVSLIEAMGLGLIPVVADIPGISEWLTAENGFLFELGNQSVLLDVIEKVNATNLDPLRLENHNRVKRHGIFEDNVAWQIALMRKITKEKSRSA